MKTTTKMYLLALVLCLGGAVLLDLRIWATGTACAVLGILGVVIAPIVADIIDSDRG